MRSKLFFKFLADFFVSEKL